MKPFFLLSFTCIALFTQLNAQIEAYSIPLLNPQTELWEDENPHFTLRTQWTDTTIAFCEQKLNTATGIMENSVKSIYSTDSDGNSIRIERLQWHNVAESWLPEQNNYYSYTADNQLSSYRIDVWDQVEASFITRSEFLYFYDSLGNMPKVVLNFSLGTNHAASITDSTIFDSNGNEVEKYQTRISLLSGEVLSFSKHINQYNASSQLLKTYTLGWEGSQFDTTARQLYTYDPAGNEVEHASYTYDDNSWNPIGITTRRFDGNNRKIEEIVSLHLAPNWTTVLKQTSSYDSQGNLSEETLYQWDTTSNQFILNLERTFTYDLGHQLIESTRTYWSFHEDSLILEFQDRSSFLYDEGNNRIQSQVHMWDTETQAWFLFSEEKLCDMTLSTDQELSVKAQLFPNPTDGLVFIRNLPIHAQLILLNKLGQRLHEQQVFQAEMQLDLSQFGTKGMHIIQIIDQGKSTSLKLMVK